MAIGFDTLLIANRGEIACRIMRTARRLGLRTVAVYSDADAGALHVREADVAARLGPAPAQASYLNVEAVLEAAAATGSGAIHPGYGFLSENAEFAAACESAGLIFVGPSAEAIRAMGSKIEAKRLVAEAGTAVVPGYQGDDQSDPTLRAEAQRIGYPLLIKASAGGGGKGMRLVRAAADFASALEGARREAQAAFGDDRVLLERYLQAPRHLEVQILADGAGATLHLLERDCSVQRRHQKVIEEAPAPGVTPELRSALGAAAVRAAEAIAYRGAGTVEFIAERAAPGEPVPFYFMEMNTRLQVEHPVTEAVTGIDLVEWQLRVAGGARLPFAQQDIAPNGHAMEARVYAENPRREFLPSTGRLIRLQFPGDVRVDSGVTQGDSVSVHYDPMLAKVIAHGADREAARVALDRGLAATEVAGLEHNVGFLRAVLAEPSFVAGAYDTHLIEQAGASLTPPRDAAGWVSAALLLRRRAGAAGNWGRADGFRLNAPGRFVVRLDSEQESRSVAIGRDQVLLDDQALALDAVDVTDEAVSFRLNGQVVRARLAATDSAVFVMRGGDTQRFLPQRLDVAGLADAAGAAQRISAPMPGQVIAVSVGEGDEVTAGQVLVVVEAMKMEHSVTAPRNGTVAAVRCAVGDRVEDGAELVTLAE